MNAEIRWKQRYENYWKALKQLEKAVFELKNPSELEKEGTLQHIECAHELAWKVMTDYLTFEGIDGIIGSRADPRECFKQRIAEQRTDLDEHDRKQEHDRSHYM